MLDQITVISEPRSENAKPRYEEMSSVYEITGAYSRKEIFSRN